MSNHLHYNTPSYTEVEMNKYTEYMSYVEEVVNNSNIPKFIKKKMQDKKHLHKRNNNTSWFLQEQGYEIDFQPFRQWLLQEERNNKLEQLGI
jgi:hypothetical protein